METNKTQILSNRNVLDSEILEEEEMIEIPEMTKSCQLMKSIFPKRPQTVFFQYDYKKIQLEKLIENNKRINEDKIDWTEKKNRKYCVLYKAYKNIPDCIVIPMEYNGVVRIKSFLKANLIWKLLKIDKMANLIKKLNKYQRYNHFPCTWQLGRKDNLWNNYKIMNFQYPEDFDYIPETFILPEDMEDMKNKVKSEDNFWLIKPVASSRGRGIRLMTSLETIPRRCLISRYIQNPHIINYKKYDLRLYVVITGFSPLKIYLYEEGLVRFASEDYSTEEASKHNRYMHLTNYSVNKCSNNFDNNISTVNECTGSKWSLSALRTHFIKNNLDFNQTWTKIKDIIIKSIISVYEETQSSMSKLSKNKNNLFELYGFDILVDDNLRPWLLEINLNPSLNCESDLDTKVKSALMTDIFTLIGLVPYSHKKNRIRSKDVKLMNEEAYDIDTTSDNTYDQLLYSIDEFSRQGMFDRLFPIKENVDYYSQFIKNPGEDNLMVWNYLKDKQFEMTERIFGENI